MCTSLGLSSEVLLSLGQSPRKALPAVRTPVAVKGEHPELSRIIHLLQGWSPARLAFLRKLLETADNHFPT